MMLPLASSPARFVSLGVSNVYLGAGSYAIRFVAWKFELRALMAEQTAGNSSSAAFSFRM